MYKKICIYAICKDELKFVDKWLDSMSEADYIVVLDTGSTDGTFEKLKADPRVTLVKRKKITPWRFDVARNESMKLVPKDADILMCTDFDEVLNPGWASVLRDCWQDDTTRVSYMYAWSHTETGEPGDTFTYDKIHTRDYEWVYPVHEVLKPRDKSFMEHWVSVGPKIFLHHYPDLTKSRSSYFDLLKLSMEENPGDMHVQMLLAREHLLREERENALKLYLNILDTPCDRLILYESFGRVIDIYMQEKNYDEALWYCQEWIKEDYTYREPYLLMAKMYNDMKMYTLAEAMIESMLKYTTRKYNWVERKYSWVSLHNDILSIAQFNLRKYDEAINNCGEAIKHDPNNVDLLRRMTFFLHTKLESLNAE